MANETAAPSPGIDIVPATPSPPGPSLAQDAVATARARRQEIIQNAELRDRYAKGDPTLATEMRSLNMQIAERADVSRLDAVLSGTAPLGRHEVLAHGELPTTNLMQAVEKLRESLPDEAIHDLISGSGVTQERRDFAVRLRTQLLEDREWCAKYRAGSHPHKEQMTRINAVIAAFNAEPI